MAVPSLKLNNGCTMPLIGLGTWKMDSTGVGAAVKAAIDIGYRLIDTAWCYGNEKAIGDALNEVLTGRTITRSELFIVTKVTIRIVKSKHVLVGIIIHVQLSTFLGERFEYQAIRFLLPFYMFI
ncbi:uncharacterized protein LOC144345251 [Saccoglossus kowalevskii]